MIEELCNTSLEYFLYKRAWLQTQACTNRLESSKFLSQQVHIILRAPHRSKRHSTTTLQQTILLFMDDYNGVITNSCLQSHCIWKSFQKITEAAPQLTEELKGEGSVTLLNPFLVTLPSLLTSHPNTPKGSTSHRPYSLLWLQNSQGNSITSECIHQLKPKECTY